MRVFLQAEVAAGWGDLDIIHSCFSSCYNFRLDNFEMAIADAEKALKCPSSSNLSYIAKGQALYSR